MKHPISFLLFLILIISCTKNEHLLFGDNDTVIFNDNDAVIESRSTVTICHATNSETNPWVTITINENALQAHINHGDFVPGDNDPECENIQPCDNDPCNPDFTCADGWFVETNGDGSVDFGAGINGNSVIMNQNSAVGVVGSASITLEDATLSEISDIVAEVDITSDFGHCGLNDFGWNAGLRFVFPGWGSITAEASSFGFRLHTQDPIGGFRQTSFTGICDGLIRLELDRAAKKAVMYIDGILQGTMTFTSTPGSGEIFLFTSKRSDYAGTGKIEYENLAILEGCE